MTYTNDKQSGSDIKLKKFDKLVNEKWLYRVGGISALVIGIAYVIIIVLYVLAGAPPGGGDGEAWLKYLTGRTTAWWIIIGLSVLNGLSVRTSHVIALPGIERDSTELPCGSLPYCLDFLLSWIWPLPGQTIHRSFRSAENLPKLQTKSNGRSI